MQDSLLQKYGEARLPRYTSYPTAPHFSPCVGASDYADWLTRLPGEAPVSVYLHIPFCRSMCWYCGCHTTITARDQPIADYLARLRAEIGMAADITGALPVEKVHFGGGTPTIMPARDLIALNDLLRQRFRFTPTAEVSVEIDPRTLTREMAAALAAARVSRASLGVQSFDPVVQKAIHRVQSEAETACAVADLRHFGIKNINFDLIYGLPHQTLPSCIRTALTAAAMRPSRLAVFGYAHVPSFKKHQRLIEEAALPDGAARSEQALAIAETLVAAGYQQIGLDHFALPDDDLAQAQASGKLRRNFQGYTTDACGTLLGFGASAIGRTPDGYVQNEVGIGTYSRHITAGRLAVARGYLLSKEDRVRAAVIERLMCDFQVDVAAICDRHEYDATLLLNGNERLSGLVDDGIVDMAQGVICVRRDHRFLIRAAAAAFDAYLDGSSRAHSRSD